MAESDELRRVRFSVPVADTAVFEWLAAQSTPSVSIRMLIHEQVENQGFLDVTCRPVEPGSALAGQQEDTTSTGASSTRAAIPDAVTAAPAGQGPQRRQRPSGQLSIDEVMAATRR